VPQLQAIIFWLRVQLRLTQTNNISDLINSITNVQINGEADVITAVKVAQLSLKHRQNKVQKQRIIIFCGHPASGSVEDFEDLGMRLKKNQVAVDVINFGHPENVEKLRLLVETANQGGADFPQSHFLDVPPTCASIMDVLITSPILQPEDAGGDQPNPAAGGDFADLGFDPNMDPELAMAIRMSMEEANAVAAQQNPDPVPAPGV
jgi:26S proteasome regulatory subunit N10